MSEKMRTKLIAGFLVVALIWAWSNFQSDSKMKSVTAPQTIQALDPSTQTKIINNNFIDIEKHEALPWGRSPFYLAKLSSTSKAQTIEKKKTLSWILSGIVFNNSSPTAIINKKPVKIGETIDKAIVTQIEKEKVVIKYNKEIITLTVSKG